MGKYLASLINALREQPERNLIMAGLILASIAIIAATGSIRVLGFAGMLLLGMMVVQPQEEGGTDLAASPMPSPNGRNDGSRRILIVGAGETGRKIARDLMKEAGNQCQIIGFVDDNPESAHPGVKILGPRRDTLDLVKQHAINEVIVSYAPSWQQRMAEALLSDGDRDLKIRMVPGVYEAMIGKPRFDQIQDTPLIDLPQPRCSPGNMWAKRIMDVVISFLALFIGAPILLLAALAIKLSSKGPVFYSQERAGKDGKPFMIYKLRTMIPDAEAKTGPCLSDPDDDRVTRIGRILRQTKLDEMPQFWNVLRGEMSVVGPRPERSCFVEEFSQQIPSYRERLRVLPGITGLAQVHGFYLTTVETKLKYDLMYIYNQSVLQDLKILLQTAAALVIRRVR